MENKIKKLKEIMIKLISFISFFYLCMSFIKWDINASNWDSIDRGFFILICIPISFILTSLTTDLDE